MNKNALFFGTSKNHYALPRIDIDIRDYTYTKTHVATFTLPKPITRLQAQMVRDLYEHLEPNAVFIPTVTFICDDVWIEMKLAYVNVTQEYHTVTFEFESEIVKETLHDTDFNRLSEARRAYMESTT